VQDIERRHGVAAEAVSGFMLTASAAGSSDYARPGQKSALAVRRLPKAQSRDAALSRDGAVQYAMQQRRRGACKLLGKARDGASGSVPARSPSSMSAHIFPINPVWRSGCWGVRLRGGWAVRGRSCIFGKKLGPSKELNASARKEGYCNALALQSRFLH
jgi:hypothetical protein